MKIDTRKNIAALNISTNSFEGDIIYFGLSIRNRVTQFFKLQLLRLQIKNERRSLSKLSNRELDDMGISRQDALTESGRGLRDLPTNRLDNY